MGNGIFPGGLPCLRIEAVQFVKWRQYWFGLRALEAIIIQINKGKEYGLKSKRVGKNLGFFLSGLYWWLRCKAIRSRVEKRGKLAICIQGRLPHLQEVFLFFPSRLFRTSPPMFFFLKRTSDDYHIHIFFCLAIACAWNQACLRICDCARYTSKGKEIRI